MAIQTAFVGPGDDLYRLAARFYGDASAWTLLRNANPQLGGDARVRKATQIIVPEFNGLYAGNGLILPGITLPLNNSVSIPATDVVPPPPAPPPVVTPPVEPPVVIPPVTIPGETLLLNGLLQRPHAVSAISFANGQVAINITAGLLRPRLTASLSTTPSSLVVRGLLPRPRAVAAINFANGQTAINIAASLLRPRLTASLSTTPSSLIVRGLLPRPRAACVISSTSVQIALNITTALSRPHLAASLTETPPFQPPPVAPGPPTGLTANLNATAPGAPTGLDAELYTGSATIPGAPSGLAATDVEADANLLDSSGLTITDSNGDPLFS